MILVQKMRYLLVKLLLKASTSKTDEEKNSFAPVISHCPINISEIRDRRAGRIVILLLEKNLAPNYIMVKSKVCPTGAY